MIGTRLAQRYELVKELGRGGMGVVYLARDPHLDREVAIKVLSVVDLESGAEERFLREAQIVARMDHPSIVPIYDLGRHQELLFFVMPVMRGRTLHEIAERGFLALGDTLEVVAQVAEALDYSHQRGVVHRDIKPENVMVSREDGRLRARVMDFGLALGGAAGRLTQTGNLAGTLGYLSPEQILGAAVDGRSDIYSLGTILYECLAGKPPFSGARYALLYQIANEAPPPLAGHGIDPALEEVVLRCLAKDPAARPARGNDLAALLRSHLESLSLAGLARELVIQPAGPALAAPPGIPPLVGREREIATLRERLELAAAGECQLVLIGGEPGMGKTRLLAELEQIGRARGFLLLRGRFSDQESAFPFQGFGELIQDFYLGKEVLSSSSSSRGMLPDLRDLAGDLLTLFPALFELKVLDAEPLGRLSEAEEAAPARADLQPLQPGFAMAAARRGDPTHVFEILARALTRLAGGKPAIFLLEHLHGAEISIEALHYIVRRLGPTPSLFACTYRQTEVPRSHPLNRLLKSVYDEPRFASLVLEPLSVAELRALVVSQLGEGEISSELAEKLHEATEGNPFFTLELIRSLIDAAEVSRDSSGVWVLAGEVAISPDSLPETIQQAVESRLERLPDELLEVLQVASVLGRTFDYQDLEALYDDVDDAVERLLAEGLFTEERQTRSDLLHFSSGVVRDVLHGNLSRRRRRRLHRRHAANLEQRYAGRLAQAYPQLVHHFAAGDVAEKTVEYALKLARKSLDAMGSAVAVHALRTALEFVEDEEVGRSTEGELRFLLARALRFAAANEPAVKEAAKAVRVFQQVGDTAAAARAALLAAATAWQGRRVGETRRWVDMGIDLARAADTPEVLRKLLTLGATVANLRGEHQKARERWEEAQELVAASLPAEEPLPRGGTLVTSLPVAATAVDPRQALTLEDKEVLANVFEPLIEFDAEGHLSPCLCEEWQKSPDSRLFHLRLRRDVRFSDGTPLRAVDVKRSLESVTRHRAPPACAALDGAAAHAAGAAPEISGIEISGEHTLRFRLREPLPILPILLSDVNTAIHRIAEDGSLVGTGPFQLEPRRPESVPPQVVRLARNPYYWRALPLIDSIEFRTLEDGAAALRSGEIDVGRDFRPEELDQLLRDARFRAGLVEATRQNVYLVALNLSGPRTREPEVRRVLLDVIRVRDLVWRTLGRFAQPASCLIPPGILGHDPGRRRPHLTRKEGRELLRSSGLELPLELKAVAHPLYFERYRTFIEALLGEWEAVGIEVTFADSGPREGGPREGGPREGGSREGGSREGGPRDVYLEKARQAHGMDLWIGRRVADYDDPDNFTYGLLHSRDGLLAPYFASAAVDELALEARREESAAPRQILYHKLEDLLAAERALLPLFYDVDYRLVSPRVRGLKLLSRPPYVSYTEVAKLESATALKPPDRDSGVIYVPLPTAVGDLSPRQAQITGTVEAIGNVFETLTRLDEGARIVPGLAAEFRLEEGGRRFRFKLRNNVRFHDGRKLTVRDVRYTFEELIRSLGVDAFEANLVPICGGREFWHGEASELEGFVILSANEFVIALEQPLSFFPAMLTSASTAIVPEGTRRFDGNWRDGCVGTGPFRVLRFDPGERLELEAHPHYWRRGLPKCDRLVFDFGIEPGQIREELRAGRLALASHLRPVEVDELLLDIKFAGSYRETPGFSTFFLILGARRGPLADRQRRRAFRQVLADANLVRSTLGRLAAPAHGLIPPGLLGHEPRGRRSAAESEGSGDQPLAGLALRAAVLPAFLGPYAPFWEGLAQALEKAGATLEVTAASPVETLWRVARGETDLAGARWAASYPDPDALIHFFHSLGYLGDIAGDAELDELFNRGRSETDPMLRHTLYRQIDQILGRHDALIPLFYEQVYRFAHPDLRGLRLRFGWPEVAYEELGLAP